MTDSLRMGWNWPEFREKLTMLVIVGTRTDAHSLRSQVGIGSESDCSNCLQLCMHFGPNGHHVPRQFVAAYSQPSPVLKMKYIVKISERSMCFWVVTARARTARPLLPLTFCFPCHNLELDISCSQKQIFLHKFHHELPRRQHHNDGQLLCWGEIYTFRRPNHVITAETVAEPLHNRSIPIIPLTPYSVIVAWPRHSRRYCGITLANS